MGISNGEWPSVRAYLANAWRHSGAQKQKTSFTLDRKTYQAFKEFCHKRGIIPSLLLEAFMKDVCEKAVTHVD